MGEAGGKAPRVSARPKALCRIDNSRLTLQLGLSNYTFHSFEYSPDTNGARAGWN